MRREALFLADIIGAADAIARSLDGRSHDDFLADDDVRASILYRLVVVGEAARNFSPARRDRYPTLPWRAIIGLRNRAVHAYFGMNWDIVWDTATIAVPLLRRRVAVLVAEQRLADDPADEGELEER